MNLTPDEIIFWQRGIITINATLVFTWSIMMLLVLASWLVTRKALLDLANANLETQIIETFIARIDKSDRLATTLNATVPRDRVVINSSFAIYNEQKTALINAVKEKITQDGEIQFAIKEDLICGIELRYGGYKISWNVDSYLSELETITARILSENDSRRV